MSDNTASPFLQKQLKNAKVREKLIDTSWKTFPEYTEKTVLTNYATFALIWESLQITMVTVAKQLEAMFL